MNDITLTFSLEELKLICLGLKTLNTREATDLFYSIGDNLPDNIDVLTF
jgi:hypothetical protein